MLSKETFCKALCLIEEQDKTNAEFSEALQRVGNGYYAFGGENKYLEALLLVLKEGVNDKYDYIGWWLYETEDYRVWSNDESKEWNLKEPEALYDFIVNDCD